MALPVRRSTSRGSLAQRSDPFIEFDGGVLTVRIPKAERNRPRDVPVTHQATNAA